MMKRALLFILLALSLPVPAFAHAMLVSAEPAVGSTITASPKEIRLKFSEVVRAEYCRVELAMADGMSVPIGPARADDKDKTLVLASISAPLAPGTYKVTWHVLAFDAHKTHGDFTFEVKAPNS
jgi:hypothetical protein